jgi:membrane-associated protein
VAGSKAALVLVLALRLHHHFHGPPFDYATIALAAFASWVGIPGPGEPILITAGIFAAKGKLDIGEVLAFAFAGATAGGVAGYYIGKYAGRAVLTTRGPFHATRRKALARGEEVFGRFPVLGILLTPSWIPGILHTRRRIYLPTNALGAAIWAVGIGLGAYFVGPSVLDVVGDIGFITVGAVAVLIAAAVVLELRRRKRRSRRGDARAGSETSRPT